jgi:CubicO group peptidase (beta-lactamase class C family)
MEVPHMDEPVIRAQLSTLAHRHRVPGVQLAIRHGDETMAVAVGDLEHGGGRPVTPDAAFPVGSITKSFTATTAMILVADGDLELDAPVGEYLPELDGLGDEASLRHLLSHTSGLASGPDSEDIPAVSLARFVTVHCHDRNLVLSPGSGFSYSNLGYVLVGRLIEVVTGMSWPEAVASILLRPLGIEPAFVCVPGLQPAARPIAVGHSVNVAAGRTRPVRQSLAAAEAPAGALAVSAADLVRLGRLHVDPELSSVLAPSWAAQMRQADPEAIPFGLADGWGLGLAVFEADATEWVGHDGNGDGTSCYLRVDPAGGWVVAFTSNANTGVGMWRDLVGVLAQHNAPLPRPCVPARSGSVAAAPDCAGTYTNGDVEYVVAARAGALHLAVDGDAFTRLTVLDDLTFWLLDPESSSSVLGGRFVRDPATARVDAIQVGGRLARRQAHVESRRRLIA